ncbi:YgiW/YdeI family stress tolerance OB fold protein [Ursidibacter maritimus]|uniref:YgiW/YdeI family stress tolerance OB fold protein n=1 Tax=Ursidibacter maritimus TaxID=1331689 RepID=UPI001C443B40|nr:NirD/YgiW/YdeI family stress tolerance protein [Ursidibacter maritimus]MBV6541554.1 YgiW/YdeI family stress tolerance OB fold protein [Ursidibacter maritimus]
MKKLIALTATLVLSTSAFAGFQGNSSNGGFNNGNGGSTQNVSTIAQVKKAHDDTYVALSGYIVSKVGDEKYTFKDSTGQIRVEIDDDLWGGLQATPKTKVRIYGQVDHDNGRTEIDVKRISR